MEYRTKNKTENKQNKGIWAETEQQSELQRMKRRRAIDRHFEGWTVREVLCPNGTIRHERVYVGDYYFSADSKKQSILRKILYCLLFAAAIALLIVCAVQRVGANRMAYVGLSQGIVLMAAIWVLYGLFTYVTAAWKMTVADYKGGVLALKRSSFYLALSFLLPALATLVHIVIDPAYLGRELLCSVGYLAGGGLIYLLHRIESRIAYDSKPSPAKRQGQSAFDVPSDTEG